jgi:hypothetical protein
MKFFAADDVIETNSPYLVSFLFERSMVIVTSPGIIVCTDGGSRSICGVESTVVILHISKHDFSMVLTI